MIVFAPGTLVDPPLAPTVRGLAGPPFLSVYFFSMSCRYL